MTVLDERGEPVQVEYVGPGRYLASGWWGCVGRYAWGGTASKAARWWLLGSFMPLRDRHAERMRAFARQMAAGDPVPGALVSAEPLPSDERPGGRPGVTQKEIAKRAGLTRQRVSQLMARGETAETILSGAYKRLPKRTVPRCPECDRRTTESHRRGCSLSRHHCSKCGAVGHNRLTCRGES